MKRNQFFDNYPRPDLIKMLVASWENMAFFTICSLFTYFCHKLSVVVHPYTNNYISFFTCTYLILVTLLFVYPSVCYFLKKEVRDEYHKIIYNFIENGSVNTIVLNVLIPIICNLFLSNGDELQSQIESLTFAKYMVLCFMTTITTDAVGYPFHRLTHWMMKNDSSHFHSIHHMDKSVNINFVTGAASSIKEFYPTLVMFYIFILFDNIKLFYIYILMIMTLFSLEHCRVEGMPFITHHVIHHKKVHCNYADFYVFIDYLFGTLIA